MRSLSGRRFLLLILMDYAGLNWKLPSVGSWKSKLTVRWSGHSCDDLEKLAYQDWQASTYWVIRDTGKAVAGNESSRENALGWSSTILLL